MSLVVEIVGRFLMRIAIHLGVHLTLGLMLPFLRRSGDFIIEIVTLDYFRDHSKVPMHRKALHPLPDWAAAILGTIFWCAFALAAWVSWPWLAQW
jgi:hypothetical protein